MVHRPKAMRQMTEAAERYVLERDRRPPHESKPEKQCDTCKHTKPNDFNSFPAVKWGDRKFGKKTTGSTCKDCCSKAISKAMLQRNGRWREAGEAIDEDVGLGRYLVKK